MPRQRDAITILSDHESAIRQMRGTLARIGSTLSLDGLSDVVITTPTTGHGLMFDGANWVNRFLVEADISDFGSYLPLSGGGMGGNINMNGNRLYAPLDPTTGVDVGDRDYNDARYVNTTGDTMTGDLTISKADPQHSVVNTDNATGERALTRYASGPSHAVRWGTEQNNWWIALWDDAFADIAFGYDGTTFFIHGTEDAGTADGSGLLQIGKSGTANIGIDQNEIAARNGAGGTSPLFLNFDSGQVIASNNSLVVNANGDVEIHGSVGQLEIFSRDADNEAGVLYNPTGHQLYVYLNGGDVARFKTDDIEFTKDLEIVHSTAPFLQLHDSGNVWFKLDAGSTGSYMTISSNVTSLWRVHPSVSQMLAVQTSTRPQFTAYSDPDTGLGLPANNYWELWAANTVSAYGSTNDMALPGSATTTDNGLPSWRVGGSSSILELTSSEVYKKYIKRTEFDELVTIFDQVEIKTWKERKSERNPKPSKKWIHGVIAEEVATFAPDSVSTDSEGHPHAADPATFLALPTLAKVKRLEKQYGERLAALEEAVAALSA